MTIVTDERKYISILSRDAILEVSYKNLCTYISDTIFCE